MVDGWTARVVEAIGAVVASSPGIAAPELMARVRASVEGTEWEADDAEDRVERLLDQLILDGQLEMLAPDRLVDPARLAQGLVLTHRIDRFDVSMSRLSTAADLCGLGAGDGPFRTSGGEPLEVERGRMEHRWWRGPAG
jgi:hypothetical protein